MKKRHLSLFLFAVLAVTLTSFMALPQNGLRDAAKSTGYTALLVGALVTLALAVFISSFDESMQSSKGIALTSILGTLSAVSRVPFGALPSVQPSTYLIICSGYVFGPVAGFTVGALTPLISNFFLGHGPWTPYQMVAWGLAGASASLFRRFKPRRWWLMCFGVCWGYIFGVIMNVWFWASFVYPLTLATFAASQGRSLLFDTLHAVGNAAFLGTLGLRTIRIFDRYKKRFNVQVNNELEAELPRLISEQPIGRR
ncbi:MAG: ECF transporter S component [Candidatus Bathyarchaeia archaeon]